MLKKIVALLTITVSTFVGNINNANAAIIEIADLNQDSQVLNAVGAPYNGSPVSTYSYVSGDVEQIWSFIKPDSFDSVNPFNGSLSNKYFRLRNATSRPGSGNQCLNFYGKSSTNNTANMYSCTVNDEFQVFYHQYVGMSGNKPVYQFKNKANPTYCINTLSDRSINGSSIKLIPCVNSIHRNWVF